MFPSIAEELNDTIINVCTKMTESEITKAQLAEYEKALKALNRAKAAIDKLGI